MIAGRIYGCVRDQDGTVHYASDDASFDDPPDMLFAGCEAICDEDGYPTTPPGCDIRYAWTLDDVISDPPTCMLCIAERQP